MFRAHRSLAREVWVGSPQLLSQRLADDAHVPAQLGRLQHEGKTVVFVGADERLLGLWALRDEPRPEAARAVQGLRRLGVAPRLPAHRG